MRINKLLKDSRCSRRTVNTAINTSHCVLFAFRLYNDAQGNKGDFNRSLRHHHRAEPENTETQEAWGSLGIST